MSNVSVNHETLQHIIFAVIKAYNDFKESEHPRDSNGRFTDTGSNTGKPIEGYVKSDPKSAIKITGQEFGEFTGDRVAYIKRFKSWYKENLQGKYVTNPLLGKVFFYGRGASETKNWNLSNPENLKYIVAIPWIIKRSKEIVKEKVKHPKQGVKCVYRVKGFIKTGNDKRKVNVVILEYSDGKKYYTFDAKEKMD